MYDLLLLQCYFRSTETVRTTGDGEPRTASSTFTQLLHELKRERERERERENKLYFTRVVEKTRGLFERERERKT